MDTIIRKGARVFYGDAIFSHGLARSGFFNKRESEELADFGETFQGLASGTLLPENAEEQQFIHELQTPELSELYAVKLWHKYEKALHQSQRHHGFINSESKSTEKLQSSAEIVTEVNSDDLDEDL